MASNARTTGAGASWALAAAGAALGLAAMAVDHLLGDDPGLEDPPTFLVSATVILLLIALLFGFVVPRARDPRRTGFILALLSVLSLAFVWLGAPFAVAPAAIALGLRGEGRLAAASVVIGSAVLLLATGVYGDQAIDKV